MNGASLDIIRVREANRDVMLVKLGDPQTLLSKAPVGTVNLEDTVENLGNNATLVRWGLLEFHIA